LITIVGCKKKDSENVTPTAGHTTGATVDKTSGTLLKVTSTTQKSSSDRYLDIKVEILSGNTDTSYAYNQIVLFSGTTRVMDRDVLVRGVGKSEQIKSKSFDLTSEYTLLYIRGYTTVKAADTLLRLTGN
jgi:hypothetical protein